MIGISVARACTRQFASGLLRSVDTAAFNKANSQQLRAFRRPRDNQSSFSGRSSQFTDAGAASKSQLIAAGSAIGLGGLCIYGLVSGPKSSLSAMDKMNVWPQHVKERIRSTYVYLAGSTLLCAGTAIQLSKNMAFVARTATGIAGPLMMLAASIGCGIVCRMMPYPADGGLVNAKHAAWLLYSASLGAMVAPMCLIGGPIAYQAAMYTAGIVGGLSLVGACAPSDKFLYMGGPLAIGFGVVFVSSLGTLFASPVGRLGMGLQAISLYGGLVLFSGFLLYDTQKVIHRAEATPYLDRYSYSDQIRPFDPINNSMNILIDSVNIFVRMVAILSGNSRRK